MRAANHDISDKWIAAGADQRTVALRDVIFLKDNINIWLVIALYVALSGISIGCLPQLFPGVKAQYVVVRSPSVLFCLSCQVRRLTTQTCLNVKLDFSHEVVRGGASWHPSYEGTGVPSDHNSN